MLAAVVLLGVVKSVKFLEILQAEKVSVVGRLWNPKEVTGAGPLLTEKALLNEPLKLFWEHVAFLGAFYSVIL